MAGENYDIDIGLFLRDNMSRSMQAVTAQSGGMTRALGGISAAGMGVGRVLGGPFVGGLSLATSAISAAIAPFQRLASTLLRYVKYAALAAAAAFTLFARQATMDFASYEQAIVNAVSVTGLMGEAFDEAKQAMFDFGLQVSLTSAKLPTEIADAFYALGSAGLDVAQQMDAARGVIALGEATMADMGQTTELVLSVMKGFGLEASQTDRVVNMLAATISNSFMTVERLATAFPHAAAAASGFGLSAELTSAVLATLADNGLRAEMAGTGLRGVLAKLSDVSTKGQGVLAQYGLSLGQLDVASRGFLPVIRTLTRAQMTQADLTKLFGIEAANAASILTRAGAPAIEALVGKITDTNRAYEMQEQQLNTLLGQYQIFRSTLQYVRIAIAGGMGPALRRGNELLREFTQRLIDTGVARRFGEVIGNALSDIVERATALAKRIDVVEWFERVYDWGERVQVALSEIDIIGLATAAANLAANTLPEWLEAITGWLEELTGMDMQDWSSNLELAFLRLGVKALQFIEKLSVIVTILGAIGVGVSLGTNIAAWGVTVGAAVSTGLAGKYLADAQKRVEELEAEGLKKRAAQAGGVGAGEGPAAGVMPDFASQYPRESAQVIDVMKHLWERNQRMLAGRAEYAQSKAFRGHPGLAAMRELQALAPTDEFGMPLPPVPDLAFERSMAARGRYPQFGAEGPINLPISRAATPSEITHNVRVSIDGNAKWIELLDRDPEGRRRLFQMLSEALVAGQYVVAP